MPWRNNGRERCIAKCQRAAIFNHFIHANGRKRHGAGGAKFDTAGFQNFIPCGGPLELDQRCGQDLAKND